MQRALSVSRDRFADWYQAVVRDADMAETSPVRGAMVIKPWGWGVWELIQAELDRRIKASGHDNCYFPLFIPLSFLAKEMAVVTHHRLKNIDGKLTPDPDAKLEEPLVVRPTSETIIGDAFSRWINSYRELPMLLNQWANVVRWEMRPRLCLRTTEFLWQEGHTAHASADEAMLETLTILEMYRAFAEDVLAMPVIAGEKPENERFPGAVNTYSIEAMMQDGKALQAGTSHFLGTHFSEAQNIRFQDDAATMQFCNTTSWGVSTRLIGGVIMTHGDDDGLRLPPAIAPKQIVVVPMLRDKPEDAEVLKYCETLVAELNKFVVFNQPLRAHLDTKKIKSAEKRWNWVRRGAPIIIEIGPRDASGGQVTFMRRDALRDGDKVKSIACSRQEFIEEKAVQLLAEIQHGLYAEAKARLDGNIKSGVTDWKGVEDYFAGNEDEFKGWLKVSWSKPTGTELDAVDTKLKSLKLTIRNAPLQQPTEFAPCLFSGRPGVEEILIGRS